MSNLMEVIKSSPLYARVQVRAAAEGSDHADC